MSKRSVIGILKHQGLVAIVQKSIDDTSTLAGKKLLPGGTIESKESGFEAIVREVQEETGLQSRPNKFITHYYTDKGTHVLCYECTLIDKPEHIQAGSDATKAYWTLKEKVIQTCKEAAQTWPNQLHQYFT